jgi:NADH:ubiquinone oxidoreductase subunit
MGVFKNIFTWWEGATFGTAMGTMFGGSKVGEDGLGNAYYEGGKTVGGLPRRWVIYAGSNDASRVPPEWHGWLHHSVAALPQDSLPPPRGWEAPAEANLTGSALAYRPQGSPEPGRIRAAATGDYEAWTPDAA